VAAECLARHKAPTGLDLGAISPDEIAISMPCRDCRRSFRQDTPRGAAGLIGGLINSSKSGCWDAGMRR